MAVFQFERDNLVPTVLEHVLKFDGILRAYAPAIPTAGTSCHVVSQMSLVTVILNLDGIGRTIVQTGQAPVTLAVDLEKVHLSTSSLKQRIFVGGRIEGCPHRPTAALRVRKNEHIADFRCTHRT